MSLPTDEFLRRFLLHPVPRGFVRIRNFGLPANRQRARLLPLCLGLLGSESDPSTPQLQQPARSNILPRCPLCRATMQIEDLLKTAVATRMAGDRLAIMAGTPPLSRRAREALCLLDALDGQRRSVPSGLSVRDAAAFLEAHGLAFAYFEGVFRVLRYDNLSSAVKKILRGQQLKDRLPRHVAWCRI